MAFRHFKAGVGILLDGVQNDTDAVRRDAVRRKTAHYLVKAEDIYSRHLVRDASLDQGLVAVSSVWFSHTLFSCFLYAYCLNECCSYAC